MHEDLKQLKERISLLEYLQRRNWTLRCTGARQGICRKRLPVRL